MPVPSFARPGQFLGSTSQYAAGPGTYTHNSTVYASLAGPVSMSNTPQEQPPPQGAPTQLLTVAPQTAPLIPFPSRNVTNGNVLPSVNSIVLAKVVRLGSRQANLAILIVDDHVCADAFQGVVRKEDVRGWEIDKVVLGEAFRVGDIIRAAVISLGDQSSYYLSTARNELGVLLATSEAGNQMHPISWKEFRDPETGKKETRKVAKPV